MKGERRKKTYRHGRSNNGSGIPLTALGAALALACIEGIFGVLEDNGAHHQGEHLGHGRVGEGGGPDERGRDVMGPVVLALLAEELDAGFCWGSHFGWTYLGVCVYKVGKRLVMRWR